jgi:hypothetical protein
MVLRHTDANANLVLPSEYEFGSANALVSIPNAAASVGL